MKYSIILIGFALSVASTAQNLVVNPSFEDHTSNKCTVNLGGFNSSILNWSTPNNGSTDFFDSCSSKIGITNYNGVQTPKTGTSYAGMYLYTDKNYREYVQGELSEPLVKGKTYIMTFYLSLADKSSFALKDIQVLFTEKKLESCFHSNRCEKVIKPSKVTRGNYKLYSNSNDIYFSDKTNWMAYKFKFTAEGYETYFSIGNFQNNAKTKKQKVLSDSPFYFSYYYLDDVSVTPIEKEDEVTIEVKSENSNIRPNEIYRFKNVLFDFDKSELLEVSKEELNQLFNHLNSNLNLRIEIYGHTDQIGLDSRNKELSEQRAKAVADYLISHGLKASRVQSFGFGSSRPTSENDTEEGRQLNRRVEFKLIEN